MAECSIDLTVDHGPPDFSDNRDKEAFAGQWDLYKNKVWKLRHNDPNYCLVELSAHELDSGDALVLGNTYV
jgi:hypothetical protein